MIELTITDDEREAIAEEFDDPEIDPRIRRKLMTIRMHDLNVPHATIAVALNIGADTVTNYVKLYRDEGLAGLMENRHYKPTSSVAPFIESISGIRLSDSQARRIMIRLGLKFRKCAAVPGKTDPQMQFDFLQDELLPRLEEARNGERGFFSLMPPTSCWVRFSA